MVNYTIKPNYFTYINAVISGIVGDTEVLKRKTLFSAKQSDKIAVLFEGFLIHPLLGAKLRMHLREDIDLSLTLCL